MKIRWIWLYNPYVKQFSISVRCNHIITCLNIKKEACDLSHLLANNDVVDMLRNSFL